jgi:hypothetical protein
VVNQKKGIKSIYIEALIYILKKGLIMKISSYINEIISLILIKKGLLNSLIMDQVSGS